MDTSQQSPQPCPSWCPSLETPVVTAALSLFLLTKNRGHRPVPWPAQQWPRCPNSQECRRPPSFGCLPASLCSCHCWASSAHSSNLLMKPSLKAAGVMP